MTPSSLWAINRWWRRCSLRLPQDFDDFHFRVDRIVGPGDMVLAEVRYAAVGKATRLALAAERTQP
jgi:hypothetical protein